MENNTDLSLSSELKNIPPHSLEAEQAVLGSILIDNDAMMKVSDFLLAEDFYIAKNAKIYSAMESLWSESTPIDLLTVSERLRDQKILDAVGGDTYLAEITDSVPSSSHIFHYAQEIKRKSVLRKLIKAGEEVKGLGYETDGEMGDLLGKAEKTVFAISQSTVKNKFVHIKEVLNTTYERLSEIQAADDKSALMGIPTGYKSLDNIITGLKGGEMIIIAARPAMGKTSFALSIAQNIATRIDGKKVGLFSLEMSKESLVERLFCGMLGVSSQDLSSGNLKDEDFSRIGGVMDKLSKANIYLDDSAGGNLNELRSKARRLQLEHGLDVIMIDYLQLMSTGNSAFAANRVQEISEISRALKGLSRELNIPVIALSQLSRAVESRPSKVPQLSDLRESGAIEQDADMVMMMYREDYYEEDSDRPGITDIYIRKHRNGPTGRVELMFKAEQMRFYDIEKNLNMPQVGDTGMGAGTAPQIMPSSIGF